MKLYLLVILTYILHISNGYILKRYSNSTCTGTVDLVAYSYMSQTDFIALNIGVSCDSVGCTLSQLDCSGYCSTIRVNFGTCSNGLFLDQSNDITSFESNSEYSQIKIGMIWSSTGCSAFYGSTFTTNNKCMTNIFGTSSSMYSKNSNQITISSNCNNTCSKCSTTRTLTKTICNHIFYSTGKYSNILLA